jgi:hypothetical protein
MSSYWSKTCSDAYNSPLWKQQQDNYGGCIFAVSDFFSFCCERLENCRLYAALLLARRMQGLTCGADCFVLCLCDVQRDMLFSFGKGRWE